MPPDPRERRPCRLAAVRGAAVRSLEALVLVNRRSPRYRSFTRYLRPYLDHFGVPYRVHEVGKGSVPIALASRPLIVAGHPALAPVAASGALRVGVMEAVRAGTGLVSFDPHWPTLSPRGKHLEAREISFPAPHWITAGRAEDRLDLPGALHLVACLPGLPIVTAGGRPLVTVAHAGAGRVVRWSRLGWANPAILGPMAGLDGVLWRSLAWAARKPFVMRGLPPLVTMRVDDVAGTGKRWGLSPLWWVEDAIRLGLKPWLGLFTHNTSDAAVRQMRPWLRAGKATAFPHALGRLRGDTGPDLRWESRDPKPVGDGPDGLGRTDAFIYYHHAGRKPWPDGEARRRLDLAGNWWKARDLPMSEVFIPHWYEAGHNTLLRVHRSWNATLTSLIKKPEAPLAPGTPWLAGGPFRREGSLGPATPHGGKDGALGRRPTYYADFETFSGRRFFNCATEIRDVAGYEWTPDAHVAQTVNRGVRQVARALDAMALGVLFTHETDHLWKIPTAKLRAELRGVVQGLAGRAPRFVTLEEGIRAVRATRTARITAVHHDPARGAVSVTFTGHAVDPTSFMLLTDSTTGPRVRHVPVRMFHGHRLVRVRASANQTLQY